MRELVLDTETTGLDPKDGHRVIELACVELSNCIPTGRHWHWYFNPERDVPAEATAIHGIKNSDLVNKPLFGAVAGEFLDVIEGARLIIHNAVFDIKFLNAELARVGKPAIGFDRVVDTLMLARRKHPGSPNNLDALCRRYGIDNSSRTKHGALLDSELLADVYVRLTNAEQAGLNLAVNRETVHLVTANVVHVRCEPLKPRLSDDEIAAHAAFIATLGEKALWNVYTKSVQAEDKAAA